MYSGSSDDSDSRSAAEKEAEARAEAEATKERLLQEEASREAVRLAGAASDEGFADVGDMYRAAEKSMSAGEFYNNVVVSTPGITGEENIVALQYNAGTWVEVEVVEVRADHVTLNMKGNGVVAFVAK